ncbi:unnamed protein product [Brassicogethes aeneus]|uniref:MANSC domain-containing protein n=1 Tax=Brassicogethes aeneus TaxID=1431903 RepID=A0A9P0FHF9_BRAAE|nr:unnamed protein product [Brassicogethes aeneus]
MFQLFNVWYYKQFLYKFSTKMFSNLFGCVFFLIFLDYSGSNSVKRDKRGDIELQTCLDNFNVHKDKIIRTQDSQNMGAKYLSEMDLGSREECLRLCCETVNCDVFVFEEKNSGSCYLFHCGPPEDFKCKFTHHVNYSSAILAVSRHTPDLENQIKLTKHEQDLSKLRKSDPDEIVKQPSREIIRSTSSTTTTIAYGGKEVLPPVINQKAKTSEDNDHPPRKCSRFQFECRSTRECIAIYNACDGVPQCADGSDEAPELECPPADPVLVMTVSSVQSPGPAPAVQPLPKIPPGPPPQTAQVHYQNNENIQPKPRINPPIANQQDLMYHPQVISPEEHLPNVQNRPEQQDFLSPINDPMNVNSRNHYNNMKPQQYVPQNQPWITPQLSSQYIPYDQNVVDPKGPSRLQAVQAGSIFNHKESGIQVNDPVGGRVMDTSDGASQRQQQYIPGDNEQLRPNYGQKTQNYYESENYRNPIQQDNWPVIVPYNNAQQYQPVNNIQDNNLIQKQPSNVYYSSVNGLDANKKEKVNPKHVQDQMAHDLKHSKDNMEHDGTTVTEKKIKIEKHVTTKHVHEKFPDVISYKIADSMDLQDGAAAVPRGAVLSLTMGLIVTCLLAILIGCRLKVVRRRMRRGGKSYAHDADYLVNGMYL